MLTYKMDRDDFASGSSRVPERRPSSRREPSSGDAAYLASAWYCAINSRALV
jgi:hypothetical protein